MRLSDLPERMRRQVEAKLAAEDARRAARLSPFRAQRAPDTAQRAPVASAPSPDRHSPLPRETPPPRLTPFTRNTTPRDTAPDKGKKPRTTPFAALRVAASNVLSRFFALFSREDPRLSSAVTVVLDIDPSTLRTAQHKGNHPYIGKDGKAHVHYFTKSEVADSYAPILAALQSKRAVTAKWTDETPLAVTVVYRFPYPKSTPKKDRIEDFPMLKTPDLDNIGKELLDVMEDSGFIPNDSKVWDYHSVKLRTNRAPSIVIIVRAGLPTCAASPAPYSLASLAPDFASADPDFRSFAECFALGTHSLNDNPLPPPHPKD